MLVAVQCMCDLLTSLPHFNFHTNLVAVLVPRMNDKFLDGQVSQYTDIYVHYIFQDSCQFIVIMRSEIDMHDCNRTGIIHV